MKHSVKYLKLRFMLLVSLLFLAAHFGLQANTVSACQQCVFPDAGSGICVGCMIDSDSGFVNCEADQSSCSCNVSGGSCSGDGHGPLG